MKTCVVIPQDAFDAIRFQGFRPGPIHDLCNLVLKYGLVLPRSKADATEGSEDHGLSLMHKQICTYGLVYLNGEVLCYSRRGDHDRPDLARVDSIGIGGHVEGSDFDTWDPEQAIGDAVLRELEEELGGDVPDRFEVVGLLNQDEGSGRVHLGVVFVAHLPGPCLPEFSDELVGPGFLAPHQIDRNRLEPWSKILADAIACTPEKVEASRAVEMAEIADIVKQAAEKAAEAKKRREQAA